MSPKTILITCFVLMLTGAALPFLMVIHVLESTLFLNFIAFMSQVAGLFMGTVGVIFYAGMKKH
jgi:hypothetical protein